MQTNLRKVQALLEKGTKKLGEALGSGLLSLSQVKAILPPLEGVEEFHLSKGQTLILVEFGRFLPSPPGFLSVTFGVHVVSRAKPRLKVLLYDGLEQRPLWTGEEEDWEEFWKRFPQDPNESERKFLAEVVAALEDLALWLGEAASRYWIYAAQLLEEEREWVEKVRKWNLVQRIKSL